MGDNFQISGSTALVTGASRGIGRHIAIELAKAGLYIAVGYHSDGDSAQETCLEISKFGQTAIPVRIDFSSKDLISDAISEVNRSLGTIDVLINNAAIHRKNEFLEITEKEWDEVFSVNIKGAFLACQLILPSMLKNQYGKIINISSIAGLRGGIYSIPYAASKAAIINLTQSLARLYSKNGVHSFCIAPSLVKTEMSANVDFSKELENIPIQRIGSFSDIAKLTRFLISDDAEYLTGQVFNPNGGEYLAL
jgi:3-oxoacyl-[acyl-carrier protein] reductase